jgi:hypothetical protein
MTATMLEPRPDLWSQRRERKESVLDTIRKTLDTAVQDDPANGVYRVSRDIFTDPQIFELEMRTSSRATGFIWRTKARSRTTTTI